MCIITRITQGLYVVFNGLSNFADSLLRIILRNLPLVFLGSIILAIIFISYISISNTNHFSGSDDLKRVYEISKLVSIWFLLVSGLLVLMVNASKLSKEQYDRFEALEEKFHSIDKVSKRKEVLTTWEKIFSNYPNGLKPDQSSKDKKIKKKIQPIITPTEIGKFDKAPSDINGQLSELVKIFSKYREFDISYLNDVEKLRGFIENSLEFSGLESKTRELLNDFEYLGKQLKVGAIEDHTVRTFFYTTIADTFILLAPYIIYRRIQKPQYCQNFVALIKKNRNLTPRKINQAKKTQ